MAICGPGEDSDTVARFHGSTARALERIAFCDFSSLPCAEFAAGVPPGACAGIIPIIMFAGFTVQEFAGITFGKQRWRVVCA